MTRIHHHANAGRARARLISTPTERDTMSTTIAGIRFSDQLAALLDHAQAHGFRVANDSRGKRHGVVVYPPNSELPPITVGERNAKFNKPHYENLRRELYRAGCPVLPGDKAAVAGGAYIASTHEEAEAQVRAAGGDPSKMISINSEDRGHLFEGEDGSEAFGRVVGQLAENNGGLGFNEAALVAAHAELALSWFQQFGQDRMNDLITSTVKMAEDNLRSQIDEALAMAADAEATAERATKALAAAEAREAKAREDCGAALERAKAAEASAAAAEAALAPLRAFLGKQEG